MRKLVAGEITLKVIETAIAGAKPATTLGKWTKVLIVVILKDTLTDKGLGDIIAGEFIDFASEKIVSELFRGIIPESAYEKVAKFFNVEREKVEEKTLETAAKVFAKELDAVKEDIKKNFEKKVRVWSEDWENKGSKVTAVVAFNLESRRISALFKSDSFTRRLPSGDDLKGTTRLFVSYTANKEGYVEEDLTVEGAFQKE